MEDEYEINILIGTPGIYLSSGAEVLLIHISGQSQNPAVVYIYIRIAHLPPRFNVVFPLFFQLHCCFIVTIHTPLSREVFWHEHAKIPRLTARIYAISINSVHREACY